MSAAGTSAAAATSASTSPSVRWPSHAATIAATPGSTSPWWHSAAVWRSRRSVTIHPSALGPGALVEHDVGGDGQRRGEQLRRRRLARRKSASSNTAPRWSPHGITMSCGASSARNHVGPSSPRLRIVINPKPTASMSVRLAIRQPLVELVAPALRLLGLAQPARRVGGRIERLPLEHVGVATGAVEPRRQALPPVLASDVGPRREQLAVPSVDEMIRAQCARSSGTARRREGHCRGTGSGATAR